MWKFGVLATARKILLHPGKACSAMVNSFPRLILARTIHLDTLEPYLTALKLVKRGERIPIGL